MSRGFIANGPSVSGTANKTALTIVSGTTVRPRLFEYSVGVATAPNSTDQQLNFAVGRFTAAGTTAGSAPTPLQSDPADVAAIATVGWTHSAEPTYTAGGSLIDQWMNQRAFYRWVSVPGDEFLAPATAANGIGLYNKAILIAAVIQGQLKWTEG